MKNKKGISLIVLVITIVIMIILAAAVVLRLSGQKIMKQAEGTVKEYDLVTIKNMAALSWSDAYSLGKKTQAELEEAVFNGFKKENIDVSKYAINVDLYGVSIEEINKEWQGKIVNVVEGVPIPKGFVASKAKGESSKANGLVIYEGTESVNDTNVATARTTRNQYVWVPVSQSEFATKFVRNNFSVSATISNKVGTAFWEVELGTTTNIPLSTQDVSYISETTLAEVQAMYKSVKEYGGFYVARYEAGIDEQRTSDNGTLVTNVYSTMGKIPYTFIPWGNSVIDDTNGAVQVARNIYPTNDTNTTGVVSTLIYGVQWDAALQWFVDSNSVSDVLESTSYGNYTNHVIKTSDLNNGAKLALYRTTLGSYTNVGYNSDGVSTTTKSSSQKYALTTGALKASKINNIYDMAGNMYEWTMEALNTSYRVRRGGSFELKGDSAGRPIAFRSGTGLTARIETGFRVALYVK